MFLLFFAISLEGQDVRPAPGTFFGEPVTSITPYEFELFRLGLEDFLEVETAEEGLGPTFNGRSCAECHAVGGIGGSGTVMVLRAGFSEETGSGFRDFEQGSLVQMFAIPPHELQPTLPPETAVVARRKALPLFGNGLIEAVPEEVLLSRADPNDENGDGISGRPNMVFDPAAGEVQMGRFGWKAHLATLMSFGAEAYRDEMGITNDLFPAEACPVGVDCDWLEFVDPVPDPEDAPEPSTGMRGIDNFNHFLLLLGPPPRGEVTLSVMEGERIFKEIGCASCHVPEMVTGPHHFKALSFRRFFPYSDFLLHDIGTGDGIQQGEAGPEEIRTSPLWGARIRAPFLHDGRASTLLEAILMHANEAENSRLTFEALTEEDKHSLLAFLKSL